MMTLIMLRHLGFQPRMVREFIGHGKVLKLKDSKRSEAPDDLVQALFDLGARCSATLKADRPAMADVYGELDILNSQYQARLANLSRDPGECFCRGIPMVLPTNRFLKPRVLMEVTTPNAIVKMIKEVMLTE